MQTRPNELEQAFRRHAESLIVSCVAAPSRFIAIDGKTLRQSFEETHRLKNGMATGNGA